MSKRTGNRMADLEFTSVAQYLGYVERSALIVEYSLSAIFSFRVDHRGVRGLIARKERQLCILRENNSKLADWAKNSGLHVDSKEMVMLRSLYLQNREYVSMVEGHVSKARKLAAYSQSSLLREVVSPEVEYDELPF